MISKHMIIGFLLCYFIITIIIGLIASIKPQDREVYFLGGRRTNPIILSLTFSSTAMSGLLFLGFSGMIYNDGLQTLWVIVPSTTIGILLCYKVISKRIRVYSEYTGAITVIEILKKRYIDSENRLVYVTAILICIATTMYVSGQLIAAGKLINIIIGLPYDYSIIIFATVIVIYIIIGGFKAVCWTDVFQGISMILGSLLVGIIVIKLSNGLKLLWTNIKYVNSIDPTFYISPIKNRANIILGVTTFIGDGLMNWLGQPTLMTKYMSVNKKESLNLAVYLSVLFQLILFGGVMLVSLYMKTEFISPSELPLGGDTETIIIQFFMYKMNPFLSGIVLGGIIAAIMSTADSLIMLTSSIIVNDIYYAKNPGSSSDHLIKVSRVVTAIIGLMVVFVALNIKSVLTTAWFGWSILGIVGVPVIVGLYWKKATLSGAIWSQIIGIVTITLWVVMDMTSKTNIFYAFIGGFAAYSTIIAVSYFTKGPPEYIQREVEELGTGFKYSSVIRM